MTVHGLQPPSDWVRRWSHLVPEGGRVLDVACGHGRHLRWFASRGHPVAGVDRDPDAVAAVAGLGRIEQADIENGPWPFAGQQFDAVVVTHYLWRPLLDTLVASVAPGGVLIYETFADGNETVGKPSRPDFLLRPGELLQVCQALRIVAFEDGFLDAPPRYLQRIAAVRPAPGVEKPRYALSGGSGQVAPCATELCRDELQGAGPKASLGGLPGPATQQIARQSPSPQGLGPKRASCPPSSLPVLQHGLRNIGGQSIPFWARARTAGLVQSLP